jgi:hypothetical protein
VAREAFQLAEARAVFTDERRRFVREHTLIRARLDELAAFRVGNV